MNSIWNKNIQLFKSRFPSLADFYSNIIEDISRNGDKKDIFSFWKVIPAKNGSLTAQIDNMLLHSSYNPQREAQSTARELAAKNKESLIFLGAGLGWQFCEMARLINSGDCPVKKLVLIEPDPLHFFAALYYIDWAPVFAVGPLIIALGCPTDSLMPLLEGNSVNTAASGVSAAYLYAIPAFIQHAKPYFDAVIALIERNRSKNEINSATYKKFEKLWIHNSLKNIDRIGQCRSLKSFAMDYQEQSKGKIKNFVLVAAGPSLESILHRMKEISEHAVIVCVETALHALLRVGVQPDFIVITDPQYYAYKHIAGLASPSSILICPLSVYPAVFRFKCREILLCSEMFPVSGYFESKLGDFGDLGAGGSVASSAWTLCGLLGARNIYFAGLDLSYAYKQTHIKGSSAEQAFLINSDRLDTQQNHSAGYLLSAIPEYAQAYDGSQVLTDSRMKMFAWWFESKIASTKDIKNWSLCPQSMKIPGVQLAEVEELLSSEPAKRSAIGPDQVSCPANFDSLKQSFYDEVEKLAGLVNSAVEKCIIGGADLLNELSKLEEKIAESPLNQIIALARPVTDDKIEMYTALQKTMRIYYGKK